MEREGKGKVWIGERERKRKMSKSTGRRGGERERGREGGSVMHPVELDIAGGLVSSTYNNIYRTQEL